MHTAFNRGSGAGVGNRRGTDPARRGRRVSDHLFVFSRCEGRAALTFFAGAASSEVTRPVGCIFATMCGAVAADLFLALDGIDGLPGRRSKLMRLTLVTNI